MLAATVIIIIVFKWADAFLLFSLLTATLAFIGELSEDVLTLKNPVTSPLKTSPKNPFPRGSFSMMVISPRGTSHSSKVSVLARKPF